MFEEAENAKVSPHTRSKTWPFLGAKCSICSSKADDGNSIRACQEKQDGVEREGGL